MKILSITSTLLLATAFNLNAQSVTEAEYPEAIVKTVTQKFPGNDDIDWRMKDNLYEVEIDNPEKGDTWMRFDHTGKLLAQKEDISPAFLPANVSKIVEEQYPGLKAMKIEKMDIGGKTYYQVELKGKHGKLQDLVFSQTGEITLEVPYWH